MPGLDRTGPEGQGSRTGRQQGKCSNNDEPLPESGFGIGRGMGRGVGRAASRAARNGAEKGMGRGMGRGWKNNSDRS